MWPSFSIWASLALAVSSMVLGAPADVEPPLKQLTQSDFSASVAQGLWLVEFFSPYCIHCKKFKPTWAQVVEEKSTSALSFDMAQVDCIAQGDLCQEQAVPHYPFMQLYNNGLKVETYNGDRSHDDLVRYIDDSIKKYLPSTDSLPATTPEPDSEVAQNRLGARSFNTAGEVLVLNGLEQFDATLSEGPLFVKMYAPWCGHCKKLAPVWKQLATNMKGALNIAEVDCDENKSLCQREAVDGYPMMFFYQNGRRLDYRGARKLPELEAYSKRLLAASTGLQPLNLNELDDLIRLEPAFFIYLYDPASSSEKVATELLRKTAIDHAGGAPIYASDSLALFEEFSVSSKEPVLISVKDHVREPSAYFFLAGVLESDLEEHSRDLDHFLVTHRFPSSFELTSTNFQEVMRGSTADAIVIAPVTQDSQPGPKDVEQTLAATRKAWTSNLMTPNGKTLPALFVWMDVDRWEDWLQKMYGFKKSEAGSRVILANHKRLVYYDGADGKPIGLSQNEIVSALQEYGRGATLKYSEGFFTRTLRGVHDSLESAGEALMRHIVLAILLIVIALAMLFAVMEHMMKSDVRSAYVAPRGGEVREKRSLTKKSRRLD